MAVHRGARTPRCRVRARGGRCTPVHRCRPRAPLRLQRAGRNRRRRGAAAGRPPGRRPGPCPGSSTEPRPDGPRINMLTAIRRTLDHELAVNPRMLVFGEDVGRKGGVHAATLGLQEKYGVERVFDTSLSEEGIIGRAVGMALAGLMPVPEIQFRKYAEPAAEQLNDCGSMRWRTANRYRRAHGRSHARWLLQVWRPLAQSVQRGAVRARSRLAPCDAVECRGCGGAAAVRPARQRSDDLLRAPRDARRRLGAPPVPGR